MPSIQQREVVTASFQGIGPHPAIVLSPEEANYDWVICVMITSKPINDEFTFALTDEMFNKGMIKPSQVRLHLVTGFPVESVVQDTRPQTMKLAAFKRLIARINEVAFGMSAE